MDFNQLLVRCSALGAIMTNITSKELTSGHLTFCKQLHREYTSGRRQVFGNKYTKKGLLQEEEAITVLSRYLKTHLKKNKERLNNFFLTGHPDAYIGEDIRHSQEGFDTKCSWTIWTFPYPTETKLDGGYEFQNHGYMYLTGAKKWTTAYTLVNTPLDSLIQEKKRLWYNLDQPEETDDEYVQQSIEIEKNMIFDMEQFRRDNPYYDLSIKEADWKYDIPLAQRVIMFEVQRDEEVIAKIAERVQNCRKWITAYHNKYYQKPA